MPAPSRDHTTGDDHTDTGGTPRTRADLLEPAVQSGQHRWMLSEGQPVQPPRVAGRGNVLRRIEPVVHLPDVDLMGTLVGVR